MEEGNKEQEQRRKECLRKSGVLLSSRDYTCSRLREKLMAAGFEEDVVASTIESLKEAHYLDDESRARIRLDLESRGVPSEIASRVLSEETQERGTDAEIRQILKLMKKRRYDPQTADWDDRNKMQAFLYRKGYSAASIRTAMKAESLDSDDFSV